MSSPSSSLELDSDDPLNLLLQNSSASSTDDSDSTGSPPDWSELSTLWQSYADNSKFNAIGNGTDIDFSGMSMDMDMNMNINMGIGDMGINLDDLAMDFNPASSVAIEPSALHFTYTDENIAKEIMSMNTNTAAASFPFTFQHQQAQQQQNNVLMQERRLSVGSASSSSASGASLSPVMEVTRPFDITMLQHEPTGNVNVSQDPAEQLAQRVRESAGVRLAVPIGMQHGSIQNLLQPQNAKLPIPRLAPAKRVYSVPSSASSTPPPPSSSESSPSPIGLFSGGPPLPAAPTGRPKTSHTTIERRYRTNLNARIQSLRMAVPALRVLEKSKAGGKATVTVPESDSAENTPASFGDVIDERGFVDGVKVARKCSKANVLGKAVEYIRVLKNRERRLQHEQNGLKSLVSGLVGGPALLREWETEWVQKFGGPERDEDIGADSTALGLDSDDEDEDGDQDDMDDEGGRKRKKPKLATSVPAEKKPRKDPVAKKERKPAPAPADGVVPEKRKRGRPRKVVQAIPDPIIALAQEDEEEEIVQPSAPIYAYGQPQQYLLATFALFSFFNNPLTSPSQSAPASHASHTHSGAVLSHMQHTGPTPRGWISREVIQSFHLLVSALVLISIILPWLPKSMKRFSFLRFAPVTAPPSITVTPSTPSSDTPARSRSVSSGYDRPALVHALSHRQRGVSDEAAALRAALGLGLFGTTFDSSSHGFEQRSLEQRAWVRLGELAALNAQKMTMFTRLQTYWNISKRISWFGASASDLATLALVILPIFGMHGRARSVWERASLRAQRACEKLVLEELSADRAAQILAMLAKQDCSSGSGQQVKATPIAVVATWIVRERMQDHIAAMFVKDVLGFEHAEQDQEECRRTVEAARSLGGALGDLGDALESVCDNRDILDVDALAGGEEEDIAALLTAAVLYRRVLGAHSQGSKKANTIKLRHTLANEVFDFVDSDAKRELRLQLEDARDCVNDMLVG